MPGHKSGKGFLSTQSGRRFYENILNFDITEIDGADNLHHPQGIIAEAQKLLSDYYGSYKSYFLVNGSTSGNLIMIFSSFKEGDKVLVERNCHRSVFNGILIRKLRPVYIKDKMDNEFCAPLSLDIGHFLSVIDKNKDAKGIILNYPNYYGTSGDVDLVIRKAHSLGMKVLLDSAHGAHFGSSDVLPESGVKLGADMVVMSAHKTLASLNQSAFLHIKKKEDVLKTDFYFSLFTTTSPSYILLSSMDYARWFLQKFGRDEYRKLVQKLDILREMIEKETCFKTIKKTSVDSDVKAVDLSRLVLHLDEGLSGIKLMHYLRKNHIDCEMSDGMNVVMIFSPFNDESDMKNLFEVLKKCPKGEIKSDIPLKFYSYDIPEVSMSPSSVIDCKKEYVNLRYSLNKVCAENIVPYPPGIPLFMMGEKIDTNGIKMIEYYLENGIQVLGLNDNKVLVVKEIA